MLKGSQRTLLLLMTLIIGLVLVACNRESVYEFKLEESTILYQDAADEWRPLIDAGLLSGVDDIALFTIETENGTLYWRYDGSERSKLIDSKTLGMLEEGRFNDEDVLLRANKGVYEWREVAEDEWRLLFDPHQIDASNLMPGDEPSPGISEHPARVPLLENFNLMDGTRYDEDVQVNFEWYDEESGLYLPDINENQLHKIDMSTLENEVTACDDFHSDCWGGVFEARLSYGDELEFLLDSRIAFDETASATIEIDVASLSEGATLKVDIIQGGLFLDLGLIEEPGTHTFVVETEFGGKPRMRLIGENESTVELVSVIITDEDGKVMNESREATFEDWEISSGNGTLKRQGAVFIRASYRYNPYGDSPLYAPYGLTRRGVHRHGGEVVHEVIVPEGVTEISSRAFNCFLDDCFEDLERVVLPDGVTYISFSAFRNTPALREVILPESLEVIDIMAFHNSGIEEITLPEGLRRIDVSVFVQTQLKRIEIPQSVEFIGVSAFSTASPLEEIVFKRSHTDGFIQFWLFGAPAYDIEFSRIFKVDESTRIYVPDASLDAYKAHYPDHADLIYPYSDKE